MTIFEKKELERKKFRKLRDEVSPNHLNILKAAKSNSPIININIIRKFYEQVESKTEFPAPGLLEPFLSEIWISVRGWGLLLRSLWFGDRGPLMGRQSH